MKTTRTMAHLKKCAYISVSCLALSSCLGVFDKQPERYNTVIGEKRDPIKNPKSNRPAMGGNNQARTPSGNPSGAAPIPQGELTPYDQYPSPSMPAEPATFQENDERVEAVPMSSPTYDEPSEMNMAENVSDEQSALEPSPLYYYEQQQAQVSSQPLENIPMSQSNIAMPDNLRANADPHGAQQDIDSMYDASTMAQNNYMPPAGYEGQQVAAMNYNPAGAAVSEPEPAQIAQNYVPVIENSPSPLQQFEPQQAEFPELSAIPPAPDYAKNFNDIQGNAAEFANQYSPELSASVAQPRISTSTVVPIQFEDQPAAQIEMSPSPLAQYEYEQGVQQDSYYEPQATLDPVPAPMPIPMPMASEMPPAAYEPPVLAELAPSPLVSAPQPEMLQPEMPQPEMREPRVKEFIPEPLMAGIPPAMPEQGYAERGMRRPEMQYEPPAPVVQTPVMQAPIVQTPIVQAPMPPLPIAPAPVALEPAPLPPPPVAIAPEPIMPPPAPYYETVEVQQQRYNQQDYTPQYEQPQYEQPQQPYAPPPPPVAAVDFSRQPVVMPAAPAYQPVDVPPPAPQEYVTQSEYQLDEIEAAPPPQRRQEVQAEQPQPNPEPNIYEEELVQTYDPEKNTVSIPDAPHVAAPSRVFTSAGPITLTPPPSIRARKGESIAQSKYNALRRSRGTARATLRH